MRCVPSSPVQEGGHGNHVPSSALRAPVFFRPALCSLSRLAGEGRVRARGKQGPMRTSITILMLSAGLAACAGNKSAKQESLWHGRTPGVVEADLRHAAAQLPEQGWLAKTARGHSDGYLRYDAWRSGTHAHGDQGNYRVRKQQNRDEAYYGVLQIRDGVPEFCTLNPQLSGFNDGNQFVTVQTWDYCTPLSPR